MHYLKNYFSIYVLLSIIACGATSNNASNLETQDYPTRFRGYNISMTYDQLKKQLNSDGFVVQEIDNSDPRIIELKAKKNGTLLLFAEFFDGRCYNLIYGTYRYGHPQHDRELYDELREVMSIFDGGKRGSAFAGSYVEYEQDDSKTMIQYINEDWIPEYHVYIEFTNTLLSDECWNYKRLKREEENERKKSKYN